MLLGLRNFPPRLTTKLIISSSSMFFCSRSYFSDIHFTGQPKWNLEKEREKLALVAATSS